MVEMIPVKRLRAPMPIDAVAGAGKILCDEPLRKPTSVLRTIVGSVIQVLRILVCPSDLLWSQDNPAHLSASSAMSRSKAEL